MLLPIVFSAQARPHVDFRAAHAQRIRRAGPVPPPRPGRAVAPPSYFLRKRGPGRAGAPPHRIFCASATPRGLTGRACAENTTNRAGAPPPAWAGPLPPPSYILRKRDSTWTHGPRMRREYDGGGGTGPITIKQRIESNDDIRNGRCLII